jgi:hypothetical protein
MTSRLRINVRLPLFCIYPADEPWCPSDRKILENPTVRLLHPFHAELALLQILDQRGPTCDCRIWGINKN